MKKIIVLCILTAGLIACQGKVKTNTNLINLVDMPRLTPENYVDTLLSMTQHYDQENYYYLFAHNQLCLYELLVNDMPIYKMLENATLATSIDINAAILKSGKQKLTFRLYPLDQHDVFPPQAHFSFELYRRNERETTLDSEVAIIKYELPRTPTKMGDAFIATNETYYEYTLEFEAQVLYENKGWSDGQNLKEFDPDEVLKQVERFYQNQRNILVARDANAMFSYLFRKEVEISQSMYETKYGLQEGFDSYMKPIIEPSFQCEPLSDYKMVYYGEGRVVALKQRNTEDVRLRGESALWAKYTNKSGGTNARFRELYLYLPKDKELKAENFIIIR